MSVEKITAAIRDVADFPKEGILFKDITPVLSDPELFKMTTELFCEHIRDKGITKIAAIDARGFIFAGAICDRLDIGMVLIRKHGKLPYKTYEESYDLEYGSSTLAIHQDSFVPGEKVALIDDLLATGGTAAASVNLIEKAGGEVAAILFLVELEFLKGRDKLAGYDIYAPVVY
jgi:adenine phosphoribosyltransferase